MTAAVGELEETYERKNTHSGSIKKRKEALEMKYGMGIDYTILYYGKTKV